MVMKRMAQQALSKVGYTPPRPVAPQLPGSKIGYTGAPDRTKAEAKKPAVEQGKAETRSGIDTYFTKNDGVTYELYSGERQWARVTLTLETAGPVAVGTAQNLSPVNSGKGSLLRTGVPATFTIAKGTRLYIASTAINRISRNIEAVPWLEQIMAALLKIGR